MAVNLSPVGGVAGQFFDNNGNPLSGGKIFTYAAGTTTNQVTYTSAAGVIAHSNPIILDSGGRVPSGEIWLTDGLQYKFVIKTNTDQLIGTFDNVTGINSNFINFLTETEIQTATAGQTVFTLTTMEYQPGTNSLSVFVDGVNQYDGVSYSYVETDSVTVTFTAGLHVGALVKFTTAQTLSSGVTDSSLVTYNEGGIGAVDTTVQNKLRETVSVKDFGATGDGVTDDLAAFNAAVANGIYPIYVPDGTYELSAQPNTNIDVYFDLSAGATINVSATQFFPRQYGITSSSAPLLKKINFAAMQPVEDSGYYIYPQAPQVKLDLVNQWGEYDSGTGDRTQVAQNYWSILNSGKGDCYNFYSASGALPWSGAGAAIDWGDRNSTGLGNGQVTALDDNVNLYGFGDVVVTDNAKDNVAMFGHVTFLSRSGTDTVGYSVPRVGNLLASNGTSPIDAGYVFSGRAFVSLDLTAGINSSNAAIALSAFQNIAWNASLSPGNGKFSTQNVGTTTTGWNGSYLKTTVNGVEVFGLRQTFIEPHVDIYPKTDATLDIGASSFRFDNTYSKNFRPGNGVPIWTSGVGDPNGSVTAEVGSMYTRVDGGAGTTLYVKESGTATNTGWVAK
jgi:hypothetical protein